MADRTGYRHDLERKDLLAAGSAPWMSVSQYYAETEIDPRGWYPIVNQGNQGSCRGHSLVAAARVCATLQAGDALDLDGDGTANEARQDGFSAQWAYIRTQQHDRISGDNGSTINGGVKTGMESGLCRESLWPYVGRYETRIPSGCADDARAFRFGRYTQITTEQQAFDWLQSGQGALDWGKVWPLPFEAGCVVKSLSPRAGGGGHATCPMGLIRGATLKRDVPRAPVKDDDWLYVVANSHGVSAQHNGWYYVTRAGFGAVLKHQYTACIGWSDMSGVTVRKIDWAEVFGTW